MIICSFLGLVVLATCCKNNKLQIQEIHRFISADSLKNNFTNPNSPFSIKRAYLKLIFEAYISGDGGLEELSESISSEEIAEIIELIYKLVDPKNNYLYLEGLVEIDPENIDLSWEIRSLILKEKINDFKNNAELSSVT